MACTHSPAGNRAQICCFGARREPVHVCTWLDELRPWTPSHPSRWHRKGVRRRITCGPGSPAACLSGNSFNQLDIGFYYLQGGLTSTPTNHSVRTVEWLRISVYHSIQQVLHRFCSLWSFAYAVHKTARILRLMIP